MREDLADHDVLLLRPSHQVPEAHDARVEVQLAWRRHGRPAVDEREGGAPAGWVLADQVHVLVSEVERHLVVLVRRHDPAHLLLGHVVVQIALAGSGRLAAVARDERPERLPAVARRRRPQREAGVAHLDESSASEGWPTSRRAW